MFQLGDILGNLGKLKEIKRALEAERVEVEKEGVRVVMSGALTIEDLHINPTMPLETQERLVKECVNEAIKKAQAAVARKIASAR
ncbi:MAG: YbaB/EbfC family nucleoid-associated protein [Candidatus Colwellbacteria bacterium]|nr:YbaB/EbfC family nucleoid-associated protein [Candidatus Colwellbacteria bacterium]